MYVIRHFAPHVCKKNSLHSNIKSGPIIPQNKVIDFLHNSIQFKTQSCMIQRFYLILCKHKFYLTYTYKKLHNFLLLQVQPYGITWHIHTSDDIISILSNNSNKVVESIKLLKFNVFYVPVFLMVDITLDMHGVNNSTAMKFCPKTTSHSI